MPNDDSPTPPPEVPSAPVTPALKPRRKRPTPEGPPMRAAGTRNRPPRPAEEDAGEWYRREVCQRFGHTHGTEGELECAVETLARAKQWHRDHPLY